MISSLMPTHSLLLPFIMQVEPLFARQLFYYAQQGGHYYRGYEHHGVPEHISPSEDYQRATSHHHHHSGSMMQE